MFAVRFQPSFKYETTNSGMKVHQGITDVTKAVNAGDGAVGHVHPKTRLHMKPAGPELPAQLYRRDKGVDHARRLDIHWTAGSEHAHRYRPGRVVSCTEKGPARSPDEGGGCNCSRHSGRGAVRVEDIIARPGKVRLDPPRVIPGFCAQPAAPASYACAGVQAAAATLTVATSVLLSLICFLV